MPLPKIKPCPNPDCIEPDQVECSRFRVWRVCCEGCGMEGPISGSTRKVAIQRWNNLHRLQESSDE